MKTSRYLVLAKRTIDYLFRHGSKKTAARIVHRLVERVFPYEESTPVLELKDMCPAEAQKIPFRRVENPYGSRRFSLVLPTIDQKHLYAGAWTALKVFWEAKKKLGFRARIICSCSPYNPESLGKLNFIDSEEIKEIESWVRGDEPCSVEEDEIFIVTAWWTAHAVKDLEQTNKIFYLVQDYEPGFYPWSYRYVLAYETYKFEYAKIFNTFGLYRFFEERKLLSGKGETFFEPAIDSTMFYPGEKNYYHKTGKATILWYGRPEVSRNLFELAALSLDHLLSKHSEYKNKIAEIISVGESHNELYVNDFCVKSRGKLNLDEWADLARESDVGISLMWSPHPSYPPFEMIASGMLVVTNRCYDKDMSQINDNFISAEPNIESISEALKKALDRLDNQELIRKNAELFIRERSWDTNLQGTIEFIANQIGSRQTI